MSNTSSPGDDNPVPLSVRWERSSRAKAVVSVSILALAVALLFAQVYPLPEVRDDSVEYLSLARNVAAGKGFTTDGVTPSVYRPPLFSLLLGAWFFLTGTSSVLSAAVFQSFVHAAGVFVAFLLFLELTPSLVWTSAAAIFLAMNPLLVTRVAFVLQEPTLLLFTTLAVLLSVRCIKASSTPRAAIAGSAWGLSTLAKVVTWFAPLLMLLMRFLPGRLRREWKAWETATLLLCFAAVVVPWTARNFVHFHRIIPVNEEGAGMVMWAVSHARIRGEPSGEVYLKKMDAAGLSPDTRKELLWKYIWDHPRYFLVERVAKNFVHFAAPSRDWWIATGRARLNEHGTAYWIVVALFHAPLYLLLLLGSWQWWKGRSTPALGFPVLLYLAYWAQYSLIYGDPRFGIPVYPLLVGIALTLTRSTFR